MAFDKEDLREYLKKNLKLEVESYRSYIVGPNGDIGVDTFTIKLVLGVETLSEIEIS